MKITAIILNYNTSVDCGKCIADLRRQCDVKVDIVAVDNASKTVDLLNLRRVCADANVTLLENTVNRGYSAGNNVGLRYAVEHGADLAMIVNPDMRFPDGDYVAALSRVFEMDDKIVVAATDILNAEGWHQNPLPSDDRRFCALGWVKGILANATRRQGRPSAKGYEISGECCKVSGCCFMIRMDFLQKIGYFDEYPFLYCEEAILAAQVRRAGKKMYYLADRQAMHRHIASTKGNEVFRFKQFCRSRAHFEWHYTDDNWIVRFLSVSSLYLWSWLMIIHSMIKHFK